MKDKLTWEEFVEIFNRGYLFSVYQDYAIEKREGARHYCGYWARHDYRGDRESLIFLNGSNIDYEFFPEFNETIRFEGGFFYLQQQIFDYEDTGETEEDYDGYDRPVMRRLETFKLRETKIELLKNAFSE